MHNLATLLIILFLTTLVGVSITRSVKENYSNTKTALTDGGMQLACKDASEMCGLDRRLVVPGPVVAGADPQPQWADTIQRGVHSKNPNNTWSHFPWTDGKNYIRGNLQVDGETSFSNPITINGGVLAKSQICIDGVCLTKKDIIGITNNTNDINTIKTDIIGIKSGINSNKNDIIGMKKMIQNPLQQQAPQAPRAVVSTPQVVVSRPPVVVSSPPVIRSNPSYTRNSFVVWTNAGHDLPGNPIKNTVAGCQTVCNANPSCKGFSRPMNAPDNQVNECWLKKDVNSNRSLGSTWVTYTNNRSPTVVVSSPKVVVSRPPIVVRVPPPPPRPTLIRHAQSGKCIDGNGSKLYFLPCQKTNKFQNWTKVRGIDSSNFILRHEGTGKCLDGNGKSLYFGPCQPTNAYQNFSTDGKLLRHKQSGKCLDGNGKSFYFGSCQQTNAYQNWTEA